MSIKITASFEQQDTTYFLGETLTKRKDKTQPKKIKEGNPCSKA